MNPVIADINAIEILDSRGNPTIRVFVRLSNGMTASASVPSGASTGANEAVELRDGDKKRYGGKGVLEAVASDIAIALDPAASSFYENNSYNLSKSGQGRKTSAQMTALYERWIGKYPIVSIEDGLAEKLTNAVLIKLNQIGTVTKTFEAIELCRKAGWNFVISHRSGETEDAFMADFAVAMGGGQIKTGSACRSERIAKYNRLLEIEAELGGSAAFCSPFE